MSRRSGLGIEIRWELWQRDMAICQICFRWIDDIKDADVDHVIPVAQGGTDAIDNLQLTHPRCNNNKGDQGFTEKKPHYYFHRQHGKCAHCGEQLDKNSCAKVKWDRKAGYGIDNFRAVHPACKKEYNSMFDRDNNRILVDV